MRKIIILCFLAILSLTAKPMAKINESQDRIINSKVNDQYLLNINKKQIKEKKTVDISNYSIIFILFCIGIYVFIKSDITVKKTSRIKFLEMISTVNCIEIDIN